MSLSSAWEIPGSMLSTMDSMSSFDVIKEVAKTGAVALGPLGVPISLGIKVAEDGKPIVNAAIEAPKVIGAVVGSAAGFAAIFFFLIVGLAFYFAIKYKVWRFVL
jgi:hypothetical protein